jgi:hypothetical protein
MKDMPTVPSHRMTVRTQLSRNRFRGFQAKGLETAERKAGERKSTANLPIRRLVKDVVQLEEPIKQVLKVIATLLRAIWIQRQLQVLRV